MSRLGTATVRVTANVYSLEVTVGPVEREGERERENESMTYMYVWHYWWYNNAAWDFA